MRRIPCLVAALTATLTAALTALPQIVAAAAEPGAPDAHGAHEGGIQWISPIFGNTGKMGLLWILINFAVLMWLLEKLLFSKLRAKTAAKSDTIRGELERASLARQQAQGIMTDVRARLAKLEGEVESILAEATARAEADRVRIVEAAQTEAERIKAAAIAAAERDSEQRRRALEAEIVESAIARAEVMLRGRITAADQGRMVEDFIGQIASTPMPGFTPTAAGPS